VQNHDKALVSVFRRNGMWCVVKETERSFLAGALRVSSDAPPRVAIEAAHAMFQDLPLAAIALKEPRPELFLRQ
jgi:hypothetical protein